MSYDISIGEEAFNITYNVAPMFYAAIPEKGIRAIYGKTGRGAVPVLRDMREYFEENKVKLEEMEPSNGWGTYDNTYKCLCKMVLASMNNLDEKWEGG